MKLSIDAHEIITTAFELCQSSGQGRILAKIGKQYVRDSQKMSRRAALVTCIVSRMQALRAAVQPISELQVEGRRSDIGAAALQHLRRLDGRPPLDRLTD